MSQTKAPIISLLNSTQFNLDGTKLVIPSNIDFAFVMFYLNECKFSKEAISEIVELAHQMPDIQFCLSKVDSSIYKLAKQSSTPLRSVPSCVIYFNENPLTYVDCELTTVKLLPYLTKHKKEHEAINSVEKVVEPEVEPIQEEAVTEPAIETVQEEVVQEAENDSEFSFIDNPEVLKIVKSMQAQSTKKKSKKKN